ncbi:MAG: hypothetical protein L6Q54_04195 [Leptospiraceae bacterium]|nr:hypothetical protein [Leptospiraceae bacterium]MCK6380436.1 hypothetical protein [Leptospiraceae bacterium]NUM40690.1 hypothetical protein [Leptospiraceae bacterium]
MTSEQISAMEEIKKIFKKYKTGPNEKCFMTKSFRGKVKETDRQRVQELLPLLDAGLPKELDDFIELNYSGSVWGGPDLIAVDDDGNELPYKFDDGSELQYKFER